MENLNNTLSKEEFDQAIEKMGITLGRKYSDVLDGVIDECKEGNSLEETLSDMFWGDWGIDQDKLSQIKDNFDPDKMKIIEECGYYLFDDEDSTNGVDKWMGEFLYPINGKMETIAWATSED